ncbi:hypothetical protein NADFUDRAFT_44929 [Nadsonia fulvescens var. elongata DSM 6958]|uniref:Uncharacterized protein n=1 Tax=Nadsonia fulvescens var. elongata DSM 6958 TaxID=857566 RepID=A0A1E3PSC5_9ASCO|nr:hypothetical protein NADFUDRAFT_44929 [Nadsonia fulvescens var. elongata DSM 6958]
MAQRNDSLIIRHFSQARVTRFNPLLPFESDILGDDEPKDKSSHKNSENKNSGNRGSKNEEESAWARLKLFSFKCFESAGITMASLTILGLAGVTYHKFYKQHVLSKIHDAFEEGDPAFELTMHKRSSNGGQDWVCRPHQNFLDKVIAGEISGRYFLLIGEKGTGKTSMILESMRKTKGKNCTFLDAHADPEIFRIRLGQALKFEYHEDYIGSLFSIRGPRDTSALLDIERAFNKLEEVALKRLKETGKPLILVINNAHLIRDDDDGRNLVELLQQKAESLSGSGLVNIIFNSDDYWLYERLKKLGTRLEVITIKDFTRVETINALKLARTKNYGESVTTELANKAYDLVGGRPQHLAHVSRHHDILKACQEIIDREKTWLLNQCGLLGTDMDDDVMESGKFSSSAMLLMKELVEMDRKNLQIDPLGNQNGYGDHILPELPLWRARQVMTRADYIEKYDNLNIFTIDSHSMVRADSMPMMRAFHEIASMPGFDKLLEDTCERVSAIESLGRTRELVAKDLVLGGKYHINTYNSNKKHQSEVVVFLEEPEEEDKDGEDDIAHDFYSREKQRDQWWGRRMGSFRTYDPGNEEALENAKENEKEGDEETSHQNDILRETQLLTQAAKKES